MVLVIEKNQEANGYDNNVDVSESIECTLQETNDDNVESSHSEEYDFPELTIEYLVKEIELLSTTKSTGSDDISVKILKIHTCYKMIFVVVIINLVFALDIHLKTPFYAWLMIGLPKLTKATFVR